MPSDEEKGEIAAGCAKSCPNKSLFAISASSLLLKLCNTGSDSSFDVRNIIFLALRALGSADAESIINWVWEFQRWSGVEVVTRSAIRKALARAKEKNEVHVMENGMWSLCSNKLHTLKRLKLDEMGQKIQEKFARGKEKIQELLGSGGKLLELCIEYENALESFRDDCCAWCNLENKDTLEEDLEDLNELLGLNPSFFSISEKLKAEI